MPIIFRIQDSDGRGPWKPGFSHTWSEERDDWDNLHPWPQQFGLGIMKLRDKNKHMGCGCLSISQLQRWFTFKEYQRLALVGYKSVMLNGATIIAQSDIQCVFERALPLSRNTTTFELWPLALASPIPNPLCDKEE